MASGTVTTESPNSNYHKFYSCILVVAKQEMFRIYFWLHRGSPTQYIEDYLRTENLLGKMRLGRIERLLLKKKTPVAKFDICFLYKLLQFTCGLSPASDKIWNDPEESEKGSLEHTLYCLKEIRNALSHEPEDLFSMTHEDLRAREQELSRLLARALELAGEKGAKRDEASSAIARMKDDLQDIISKPILSGFTPENFAAHGRQEMKKLCATASGVFAEVVVQQAQTATTTSTTSVPELSLCQLLRWSCDDTEVPDVILVTGDTGTGKTSLCRHIFESWCSGADTFVDLQECDLGVSIQCSEVCTSDVVQLLSGILPQTVAACGPYEVLGKLSSLNVLWLVDGYEEATREARLLLQQLVEKLGPLHTILVTTRPEHSVEFIDKVARDASLLEVRLLGLSARGRKVVVESLLREPSTSMKNLEDFERELGRLKGEVSRELLNPLKLTLTVNLWKEDIIDMKEGGTLPQLYSSIKKVHIQSLCEKTRNKKGMIVQECNRKVKQWVEILCEEAFKMTKLQKYMELTEEMQDTLRTTCDNLGLCSEDCFSTFLGYRPSAVRSGLACYSFLHNTQQFHYAAEHVLLKLSKSTDRVSTVYQLFGYETHHEIGSQFYMVLLHTIALLSASGALEKRLAKTLVKLFSVCARCIWFEVIRYAAYSKDVVSEVCKCLPNDWGVDDDNIKAARQCLSHNSPKTILITLNTDPTGNEECMPMVKMIAQRKIIVHLILTYTLVKTAKLETSDSILEIVCSTDATCTIVRFDGCVSGKSCSYIRKMPKVQALSLNFLRNKDLGMILKVIRHLHCLQDFTLIMKMPELNLQKRLTISAIRLKVFLQPTCNYDIHKTAISLKNISKRYDEVYLPHSNPESVYALMTDLGKKNVKITKVKCVLRSPNRLHVFSFGSVPSTYSYRDIKHLSDAFKSAAVNVESEEKK